VIITQKTTYVMDNVPLSEHFRIFVSDVPFYNLGLLKKFLHSVARKINSFPKLHHPVEFSWHFCGVLTRFSVE
jgi:hypothetical protein